MVMGTSFTDTTTALKPPKQPDEELLAQLSATPPPPAEPAVDLNQLRADQHAQVDTNYTNTALDQQWAATEAKYAARGRLGAENYYEYAALKQQYQLASAGYTTQKEAAHAQVDAFYDLQTKLQTQGAALNAFTDADGKITNVMALKDSPVLTDYATSLRSMRDLLSTQPGTTEEEKKALAEQLAEIDQELGGLDSIGQAIAEGTAYDQQSRIVKFGQGAKAAFEGMFTRKLDASKLAFAIPGGAGIAIGAFMGGLSGAFPKNVAWWQRNVDDRWGAYYYQSMVKPFQEAWGQYRERGLGGMNTPRLLFDLSTNMFTKLGALEGGAAAEEYKKRVPQWGQLVIGFTNPVYYAAGWGIGKALGIGAAMPAMMRTLPEAGATMAEAQTARELLFLRGYTPEVAGVTSKAGIWVSRMPQEAALAKWMDMGAKYPWMAQRLPGIAEALRPVTALQMFGNDLVPALLTPGEIVSRVALSTGNLAGAALKESLKFGMSPLKPVLGPARGLVQKQINVYQLNKALAREDLALVRNAGEGSIVIKGIGGKVGMPNIVARDIIEVDNYVQTMASPGGPTLVPVTPRAISQRMYFDELARPGEPGELAGAVYTNGEFIYGMRGSSIIEGRTGTVYSLPPEATAAVDNAGAAVNPAIANGENLTVVSEAQVRSGVRPGNISPEVWERAQEAFRTADTKRTGIMKSIGTDVESRRPPSNLEQQLWKPGDALQPVALRIARLPGGAKVMEAINGRTMAETQAQRAFMEKYAIQGRGSSDVYMAMTRVMQWSAKDSGPFSVTKVKTLFGEKTNLLVKEGSIKIDKAKWDALPDSYKSWYQHDVLSWIPGSEKCPFIFTEAQADYINALHHEIDEFYKLGVAEGIDSPGKWVPKTAGMENSIHYVPRAIERTAEDFSYKGLSESRTYETAKDSIEIGKTGIASGIMSLQRYGDATWNRISNKHFMDVMETAGKTETQLVEQYEPALMPHIRALQDQLVHLPALEKLLTEMAYRGKIPATGTVKALLERYPEIAQQLGDVLAMPVNDVATLFKGIEQKTWDQINRESKMMRAATEQQKDQGFEILQRMDAQRVGPDELLQEIRNAQHGRIFPDKPLGGIDIGLAEKRLTKEEAVAYYKEHGGFQYDTHIVAMPEVEKAIKTEVNSAASKVQVPKDGKLNEVIHEWVGGGRDEDLQLLGKTAWRNKEYLEETHRMLMKKYPDGFIRIFRGVLKDSRHLQREYTNVTSSKMIAKRFQGTWPETDPLINDILIKVEDVVSIASVYESELIIPTALLKERIATPVSRLIDTLNPEVTMADVKGAITNLNLGKDAEAILLQTFYDRQGTWNIRYARSSQKTLNVIKRLSESDYRAALKGIKAQKLERKAALKGLEDVVGGEKVRIEAAQAEAQKQYKMVAKMAEEQNQLYRAPTSMRELEGRLFTKQDADYIGRQFKSQTSEVSWLLKDTGTVSTALRALQASLDISAPLTYGLPLMVTNPAGWGRAFVESCQTLWKPEVHMKYLAEHQAEVQEFVSKYGGYIGGSEFYEGLGAFEKAGRSAFGTRFGGAVGAVEQRIKLPYWHAEKAFGAFGDVARLELWEALRPIAKSEAELYEVAQMVNKMVGVQDTRAMGISASQRAAESALFFFAPRYRRASFALMTDFFRGGISGQIARRTMTRLIGGGVALYVGMCGILQQDPVLDPLKPNFMCIRIGDKYYGLNSAIISNVKFLSDLVMTSATKPSELFKWNRRTNPTLKFLYKGSAPMVGTAVELITHKGFLGQPLETATEYGQYLVSKITPMAFGDLLTSGNPVGTGGLLSTLAGVGSGELGMRVFEVPLWTKVKDMRNSLAPFAPDLTASQKALLDKGQLQWTDLNYAQQDALMQENSDLSGLVAEAQAQSTERGGAPEKLRAEWNDVTLQYKDERDSAQSVAKSEYIKNKSLADILAAGGKLSVEDTYLAQNYGKIFRDKATKIAQEYATKMTALQKMDHFKPVYDSLAEWQAEQTKDEARPTLNQAIDDYYTKMYGDDPQHPTEDQYGNPIFDNIQYREDSWAAFWGHDLADQAKDYMHRNEDPLFAELRAAKIAMKPYWQLSDDLTASKQYPADSSQQAQWVMSAMQAKNSTAAMYYQQLQILQANNPAEYARISSDPSVTLLLAWANSMKVPTVTSILSRQRETFRRNNPEVEAYGEMFYDFNVLEPLAQAQPTSSRQTGWSY